MSFGVAFSPLVPTTPGVVSPQIQYVVFLTKENHTYDTIFDHIPGANDDPDLADGFFYLPTVVVDPPHDVPMATEEVFGPALPIWRVRDLDEAIERANASQFGLGSSVWTRELARAREAAERIEAGYTWINSRTKVYDELPFGGWKSSGYGKEHGEEAFDFYTETKSVVLRSG